MGAGMYEKKNKKKFTQLNILMCATKSKNTGSRRYAKKNKNNYL